MRGFDLLQVQARQLLPKSQDNSALSALGEPSTARPRTQDWRPLGYRFLKQPWRREHETQAEKPSEPPWCSLPQAL